MALRERARREWPISTEARHASRAIEVFVGEVVAWWLGELASSPVAANVMPVLTGRQFVVATSPKHPKRSSPKRPRRSRMERVAAHRTVAEEVADADRVRLRLAFVRFLGDLPNTRGEVRDVVTKFAVRPSYHPFDSECQWCCALRDASIKQRILALRALRVGVGLPIVDYAIEARLRETFATTRMEDWGEINAFAVIDSGGDGEIERMGLRAISLGSGR